MFSQQLQECSVTMQLFNFKNLHSTKKSVCIKLKKLSFVV